MPFNSSEAGYRARCRLGGLRGGPVRAAFWRAQGFPNLVKARAVSARNRKARKQARLLALARTVNRYALPADAELWAKVARRQGKTVPKNVELDSPFKLGQRPRGF